MWPQRQVRGQIPLLSGFGIVTLASVFPILGVLCKFYTAYTVPAEDIIARAAEIRLAAEAAASQPNWSFEVTPWTELFWEFGQLFL